MYIHIYAPVGVSVCILHRGSSSTKYFGEIIKWTLFSEMKYVGYIFDISISLAMSGILVFTGKDEYFPQLIYIYIY